MKSIVSLATRTKLFFGFGLVVLLLAGVLAVAFRDMRDLQEAQTRLYEQHFSVAIDLLQLRSLQNFARSQVLELLLAGDHALRPAMEADLQSVDRESQELLAGLALRLEDRPQFRARLQELQQVMAELWKDRWEILELVRRGNSELARQKAIGVQDERFERVHALAMDMGRESIDEAQESMAAMHASVNRDLRLLILLAVLAVLASVVLVTVLGRMIAAPLQTMAGAAKQVSAGDLRVSVAVDGRGDEVGILALAFQQMLRSLQEMTGQILDGVNVVGSAAAEIIAATSQVAAGTTQTASAVSETSTTVEEVKQTAHLSSQKAKQVAETAQKSVQISQSGSKSVEETARLMNGIGDQMHALADSILRLSEQTQAIGEIISTVKDLSDQSNLLAVNAAIEAAKAGEQGRGFAVVAQEIRNLAEQSRQATVQVRDILTDIQKATSSAVLAAEQAGKAVEVGMRQSSTSGSSIRELGDSIAAAAQAAMQISASSQQQLAGMEQVAAAMENIKQASTQNVSSSRQVESAAQNLQKLGDQLKGLVGRYQV